MKPVVLIFCGSPRAFRDGVERLAKALRETPLSACGGIMETEERIYRLVRNEISVHGYSTKNTSFAVWEPRPESFVDRAKEQAAIDYLLSIGVKQATAFGKSISPLPESLTP